MTQRQLRDLFGTTTPDHDAVQASAFAVMDLRERWHGSHLVVYEDDAPSEIFFAGFSGD